MLLRKTLNKFKRVNFSSVPVLTGEEIIQNCKDYTLWSWSAQQV